VKNIETLNTDEQIRNTLLEILTNYINEDGEFIAEFIDSLDFIEVILSIETCEFDVEFDDEMLTFESLADLDYLIGYIREKVSV
jgi:acyl carrier protein